MWIKGIGGKLVVAIIALVFVTCGTLGLSTWINSTKAMNEQVESNLVSRAEDVSQYIEEHFQLTLVEVEAIAEQEAVRSMDFDKQKQYLSKRLADNKNYLGFGIIKADGIAHYLDDTTADLGDRDYVKEGFTGKSVMSEITISRVTGEPVILIVSPIDTVSGEKALLLARMDGYYLSNIVEDIKVGNSGYAFMLDAKGTIIGHNNHSYVKEQNNPIKEAEETGVMTGRALAAKEMIAHKSGYFSFETEDAGTNLMGYHTLDNGWKMGVIALENEMFSGLSKLKTNFIVTTIIVSLLGLFISFAISRSVSRPLRHVLRISEGLSEGDFTQEIPEKYLKRIDEMGTMSRALDRMTVNMREMIAKVSHEATTVNEASCDLMGDVMAVTKHSKQIAGAINEIDRGAQSQTVMAEESASAMEQMALGIQNVAEVASTIASNTDFISQKISESNDAVQQSICRMNEIQEGTKAELMIIHKLEKESEEINLISNMIAAISDQTNLLALNASIEAARAGDAGKGFAVVAEEVRKLSEQTAESATKINVLIERVQSYTLEVVKAAELGEDNVERGLASIEAVGERFEEIVQAVGEIAGQVEEMNASAEQMSANTEEVSASMEEMAATAHAASDYVHEVTDATTEQLNTVTTMNDQTEKLSAMAKRLYGAIQKFKY
ncbi:methyl-accepting chemotaxis protein [Lysinibacillus fusiformis]|uniref:Methyl-accepting chemotaxis sensory transducer with Cache sensor n=1 Tax=Lysinibacillus fusiformis TaxID=28031 RepID=A0A1H9PNP8_9BACI|nr:MULTISPECIES: methyl-accepting chemotaxis protein [Lysinibacillus]MCG7437336.1 methyl-accepting chemotaxis protein [Lysinibacillus fusiformis]MED4667867.1 methyl-accepting chemotaxis protein [Lysinibacillus fusiformis]QAS58232.1 methyl-accepting chemotaxis protein [Lysinibacillus sphaericus]RDV31697.1 methyl-accepting chemotaxis protein [Lysinibacillus fusiformis]SCY72072.1 methyl-accepting chemotaxis sensory transducer with Cache sensor [Lysinibacillus fusiformis]